MRDITPKRKDLIDRLGFLRARADLSARELSQMIDKSDAYIAKFENGDFNIPTEVLLDAVECCGSSPEEFFWGDVRKYKEQKDFLNSFEKLSNESKVTILNLMKNMK